MITQIETQLKYPFLYKWQKKGGTSILTNSFHEPYFNLFGKDLSVEDPAPLLNSIAGNFAVVIERENYVLAAVDRVRSFPLFYKIQGNKVLFTDDISSSEKEFIVDEQSIRSFTRIFCTEGDNTLLENWKQIQAGEYVFINKISGEISVNKYFTFRSKTPAKKINLAELKDIFLKVFKSILDEIGDKTIIIPLSGGYDSRCIIAILKGLDAKNIFAYTYGTAGSFEKEIAQQVAQKLHINWHFIEYTPKLLDSFFEEKWKSFSSKNHGFTSLPNEQDFFALLHLQNNNLLPHNAVILSGYLGDYLAGCKIKFDGIGTNEDDQIEYLYLNRGSKYIVNSIRLYEYFGLEWFIPFGAGSILDYIFHVPLEERQTKSGYNNFLSDAFFKPLDIDFKKPDHYFKKAPFKNILKKYLPRKIVSLIQNRNSFNEKKDPNNTMYLRKRLSKITSADRKQKTESFNEMYAKYFIHCLKQEVASGEILQQTNK
jgi:asparagine synthase (glutamine-hydrolysing)